MPSLLGTWKDEITASAAIAGIAIGILGFGATSCQMMRTADALKASNGYQIQKDARELVDKVSEIPGFRDFVAGPAASGPPPSAVEEGLWKMFNFYVAVYRQQKADGLPASFVDSYREDFCGFVRIPAVDRVWTDMAAAKRVGSKQAEMRAEWCR